MGGEAEFKKKKKQGQTMPYIPLLYTTLSNKRKSLMTRSLVLLDNYFKRNKKIKSSWLPEYPQLSYSTYNKPYSTWSDEGKKSTTNMFVRT